MAAVPAGGFLQLQSLSGLSLVSNFSSLSLRLQQAPDPLAGATALPPPLPKFARVYLTVVGPGLGDAFSANTLAPDRFDSRGRSLDAVASRLPPSADCTVRAYLIDDDGRLVASGMADKVTLRLGANSLDLQVAVPPQRSFLVGASDSINVSDNVIVKGATLAVATGVLGSAPGVARVDVEVNGPAYAAGGPGAQLASLAPPSLDQFEWRPSNASGDYDPNLLQATTEKTSFTLTSRAYDPFDHLVGTSKLDLAVIGTAYVDVGVDQ